MEMNFCRRCGSELSLVGGHEYTCKNNHAIYRNASPACGVWIINDKNEVLVAIRARDPGIGLIDAPGGFADGAEPIEECITRELNEELGLSANDYTTPQFILSAIDKYHYGNETLDVLGCMFYAKLIGNPTITPQDDVAEARFMAIESVDPDKIYFPAVRASFLRLRTILQSETL
jgi:NAD+ diphosphatase